MNLTYLYQLFNSHLKTSFNCKMNNQDLIKQALQFIDKHSLTKTGKNKIPKKHIEALKAFMVYRVEELRDQECIFCYEVDGKLYTTFNKDKQYYSFTGTTEIPNYKTVKGIEDKILKGKGSVKSGFYYPNGKPYFISNKIKALQEN